MTTAHDILDAAAKHMRDRAAHYDSPEGERSMAATVAAFEAITGIEIGEEEGWLFMALLKAVRSQQGDYRADNYEDFAAYAALMGEAASRSDRTATAVVGPCGNEVETTTGKPSWSDAPEWANWLAQDMPGTWHWYSNRPTPYDRLWAPTRAQHLAGFAGDDEPNLKWLDTLEARP